VAPEHRGRGVGKTLVEKAEEYIKERNPAAYIMVLPQDKSAIKFWLHMGYNILNTIELAKDLEPEQQGSTRVLEVFGYPFRIWKWRREDYDETEREYLKTLEEFYRLGGTRKLYLKLVTRMLKEWINKHSH